MKQAQKLAADEIERFKTQKQAEFTSQATTVSNAAITSSTDLKG